MDTKEFVALLNENVPTKASVSTLQDTSNSLLESMEGIDSKLALLGKSVEVEEKIDAELGRKNFLDDIMSFKPWGLPLAEAGIGGFVAVFASECVDGFMDDNPKWQRGLVKLGISLATVMWGKRILGNTGSKAVGILLTFDAIRDLTPIDSWADQLAERITGTVTTAGLAGNQTGGKTATNQPAKQEKQATSYYAMAFGGS